MRNSFLTFLLILSTISCIAQVNKKLTEVPLSIVPLDGTEDMYVVQSGVSKRIKSSAIQTMIGSGTTNQLAYWNSSTTLSSLNTTTYPSLGELSYVKGVTSSIQTQLNALTPKSRNLTINGVTFDLSADRSWTVSSGGAANGDLSGTYPNPTVSGILTKALPVLSSGKLSYNGTSWIFDNSSYLTSNQTITLSGDVSGSGSTSISTTISNAAVTLAKMSNLAANSVIGNNTGSPATPIALTQTQLTTMVNNFTSGLSGSVPASGGGTLNFLRADGSWTKALVTGTYSPTITNGSGITSSSADANFIYRTDGVYMEIWGTVHMTPTTSGSYGNRNFYFDEPPGYSTTFANDYDVNGSVSGLYRTVGSSPLSGVVEAIPSDNHVQVVVTTTNTQNYTIKFYAFYHL